MKQVYWGYEGFAVWLNNLEAKTQKETNMGPDSTVDKVFALHIVYLGSIHATMWFLEYHQGLLQSTEAKSKLWASQDVASNQTKLKKSAWQE